MFASNTVTKQRNDHFQLLKYANLKRKQGVFNDVTIKINNKCFSANRLVLSCYSEFFETMFQTDMKEKYQNTVDMNKIDETSMQIIIDYIYTGKIIINEENAIGLLSAADYLLMDDLKQYCFEFLESNITSDNCFTVFDASILYENESLQNKVYDQINKNFDTVVKKEEFKNLSMDKFFFCLSNINRNFVGETSIYNAIIAWTNHDLENRESEFAEFFQLIALDRLSLDFLVNVALNENLIEQNIFCFNKLKSTLSKQITKMNSTESGSKILSLGGLKTLSKVIKVYEHQAENIIEYPDLPIKCRYHCSLVLSNTVYVIGGSNDDDNAAEQVWKMDLKQNTLIWKQIASMNSFKCMMGATVYNDALIVAGGIDQTNYCLSSSETYLKQIDEWKIISPLNQPRYSNELVSCNDGVFCLGGFDGENVLSSVEHLSDLKSEWEFVEPMLTPRMWFAAVNFKEIVFAIGGKPTNCRDQSTLKSVEIYNSEEDKWSYVSDMNIERRGHSACVLQNKIYVVGGVNTNDFAVKEIECYDIATNKWSIIGETVDELVKHKLITI